jgi:hypothetical protein
MSYIASNDNRLYAAIEPSYGEVAADTELRRIPAVHLAVRQRTEVPTRRDKTGTRTFLGAPAGVRRTTTYDLKTYLTSWTDQTSAPGYGPLIEAALGGSALLHDGGTIASAPSASRLQFSAAHGLVSGQAVAVAGELRFVTAVVDATTVDVNAPFSTTPGAGEIATPTITYQPAKVLRSASVFDFWSPSSSVQRVLNGVAVDEMDITVNADYHELEFSGTAADVIDSGTFEDGQGGLPAFPQEPDDTSFDQSVIPGHLGQVWIGVGPDRFFTLTSAKIRVRNSLDMRNREFGSPAPRAIVAGQREVIADFELYASDDDQTRALYDAARQGSAVRTMFQLGDQQGQLFGAYMKSLVPSMPEFDDSETRLLWKFDGCRAQGSGEDELIVAFG